MTKYTPTPFGIRIREAREALGLSQIELAQASSSAQTTISQLETGRRRDMSASDVFALADALRVDARWLVTGDNMADRSTKKRTNINLAAGEISLAVAALQSLRGLTLSQRVGTNLDEQDFFVLILDVVDRIGQRLEVAHNAIGEGLIGQFEYPIEGHQVPREVIYG